MLTVRKQVTPTGARTSRSKDVSIVWSRVQTLEPQWYMKHSDTEIWTASTLKSLKSLWSWNDLRKQRPNTVHTDSRDRRSTQSEVWTRRPAFQDTQVHAARGHARGPTAVMPERRTCNLGVTTECTFLLCIITLPCNMSSHFSVEIMPSSKGKNYMTC